MVETDAQIEVFEALARIAYYNHISDTTWAKASGTVQPRIGELRRIRRLMVALNISQEEASVKLQRRCTEQRIDQLYTGLVSLLGEERMALDFERTLQEEKNPKVRLRLLMNRLKSYNQPKAERYMWKLIKQQQKQKKTK